MTTGDATHGDWPEYAAALSDVFGPPSTSGFGAATFLESSQGVPLSQAAEAVYRRFVGGLWDRFGEEAWLTPWSEVAHLQPSEGRGEVVAALRQLPAPASMSVPLLLEAPEGAEAVLAAAFDDPAVSEVGIYTIGDGEAMSGLLVAGRRPDPGLDLFVVALMD